MCDKFFQSCICVEYANRKHMNKSSLRETPLHSPQTATNTFSTQNENNNSSNQHRYAAGNPNHLERNTADNIPANLPDHHEDNLMQTHHDEPQRCNRYEGQQATRNQVLPKIALHSQIIYDTAKRTHSLRVNATHARLNGSSWNPPEITLFEESHPTFIGTLFDDPNPLSTLTAPPYQLVREQRRLDALIDAVQRLDHEQKTHKDIMHHAAQQTRGVPKDQQGSSTFRETQRHAEIRAAEAEARFMTNSDRFGVLKRLLDISLGQSRRFQLAPQTLAQAEAAQRVDASNPSQTSISARPADVETLMSAAERANDLRTVSNQLCTRDLVCASLLNNASVVGVGLARTAPDYLFAAHLHQVPSPHPGVSAVLTLEHRQRLGAPLEVLNQVRDACGKVEKMLISPIAGVLPFIVEPTTKFIAQAKNIVNSCLSQITLTNLYRGSQAVATALNKIRPPIFRKNMYQNEERLRSYARARLSALDMKSEEERAALMKVEAALQELEAFETQVALINSGTAAEVEMKRIEMTDALQQALDEAALAVQPSISSIVSKAGATRDIDSAVSDLWAMAKTQIEGNVGIVYTQQMSMSPQVGFIDSKSLNFDLQLRSRNMKHLLRAIWEPVRDISHINYVHKSGPVTVGVGVLSTPELQLLPAEAKLAANEFLPSSGADRYIVDTSLQLGLEFRYNPFIGRDSSVLFPNSSEDSKTVEYVDGLAFPHSTLNQNELSALRDRYVQYPWMSKVPWGAVSVSANTLGEVNFSATANVTNTSKLTASATRTYLNPTHSPLILGLSLRHEPQ